MNIINFPSPFVSQSSINPELQSRLKVLFTEQVQEDLSLDKTNFVDSGDYKRFSSKVNDYESEVWNGDMYEDWNSKLAKEFQKVFHKLIETREFPKQCSQSKIDKVWWEFYEPYGYRSAINYPENDFTGIYVVDCQQKDILEFTSPLTDTTSRMTFSPEITSGDILIFPSNIILSSKTFTKKSLLFFLTVECKWVDHGYQSKNEILGEEQSKMFKKSKTSLRGRNTLDNVVSNIAQ